MTNDDSYRLDNIIFDLICLFIILYSLAIMVENYMLRNN